MSDSKRVYHEVIKPLKRALKGQPEHRVATLALMISSLVRGSKAQLSKIAAKSPSEAKNTSTVTRISRWLGSKHVDSEAFYAPFASSILAALSRSTIYLAMDASSTARKLQTLMFGVVYKKRLLPLCWVTYKGEKGHKSADFHIEALEKLLELVPKETNAVLLADAEYDGIKVQKWLKDNTDWGYVTRCPKNMLVQTSCDGETLVLPVEELFLLAKDELDHIKTKVTGAGYGPVMVVGLWEKKYDNPLYLVSNLDCPKKAAKAYRKRFIIETLFSDWKGRGFGLDKSHLQSPQKLERLVLAASLAYIWMVYFGIRVLREKKWDLIDCTRQDKSLFRLGMDWMDRVLNHDLDFKAIFFFRGVMS